MPDHRPRHENREPRHTFEDDFEERFDDDVDGDDRESLAGEMPSWADWAPTKLKAALTLGPIIMIPLVFSPIIAFGRVWMATNAPLLLMGLSGKAVYLAAAAVQVNPIAYFFIGIVRRIMFAPCYYFLGKWGADKGLKWMADNSPASAKVLRRITAWFPRWGPLLVMFYPAHIVRVLAGASGMRFAAFMAYELTSAVIVTTGVFYLANQFPATMESILDFIKEYQWELTALSIAIFIVMAFAGEKKNAMNREELHELEETLEESIEHEHDEHRRHH